MRFKDALFTQCLVSLGKFSNNKERNVDARGVAITILADRKLSDNIISDLTGMTRQAVNRMRNLYPDRIRRSYYLRRTVESVKDNINE